MSLENFTNSLIALSAFAGAAIAGLGLNSWKNQKRWEIDHDLAKRLLVSLFKYRDAIQGVRNPAIFSNEQPVPPEEQSVHMTNEQIRFYGISKAYENRWAKVSNLRSDLYADATEAEAYWGRDYKTAFKKLTDLEVELAQNIRQYLTVIDPDANQDLRDSYQRMLRSNREVMYAMYDDGDEYWRDFEAALYNVEDYLRLKMGSSRW